MPKEFNDCYRRFFITKECDIIYWPKFARFLKWTVLSSSYSNFMRYV